MGSVDTIPGYVGWERRQLPSSVGLLWLIASIPLPVHPRSTLFLYSTQKLSPIFVLGRALDHTGTPLRSHLCFFSP